MKNSRKQNKISMDYSYQLLFSASLSDSKALSLRRAMESILLSTSDGGECDGGDDDTDDGDNNVEAGVGATELGKEEKIDE